MPGSITAPQGFLPYGGKFLVVVSGMSWEAHCPLCEPPPNEDKSPILCNKALPLFAHPLQPGGLICGKMTVPEERLVQQSSCVCTYSRRTCLPKGQKLLPEDFPFCGSKCLSPETLPQRHSFPSPQLWPSIPHTHTRNNTMLSSPAVQQRGKLLMKRPQLQLAKQSQSTSVGH